MMVRPIRGHRGLGERNQSRPFKIPMILFNTLEHYSIIVFFVVFVFFVLCFRENLRGSRFESGVHLDSGNGGGDTVQLHVTPWLTTAMINSLLNKVWCLAQLLSPVRLLAFLYVRGK